MIVSGLDHINIGTARLAETRAFFMDVLGLTEGWRPAFPFGGAWLYAGDRAVVHLVELAADKAESSVAALDHFAFNIADYDGVLARMKAMGITCREVDVPGSAIRQIFIRDPNGVNIELNYRPSAAG
jgi:catechol 2,3-dioxygenase-like lactoylglutathione lyase family enzyme